MVLIIKIDGVLAESICDWFLYRTALGFIEVVGVGI